jgi:hypothetical protein
VINVSRWYEEKKPVHFDSFKVSLDSGAHTLYIQEVMGGEATVEKRYNADFSYMEGEEFKQYLEDYIEFLNLHGSMYDFYVTLDVIGDPKRTWDITKYIESNGLHPIPVFHYGSDFKWLSKLLDDYEFIGIGGLGQDVTKARFIPHGDKVFKYICDSSGKPRVKTHGFAMASPEMVARYPWYTCDASTWTALSRNGTVYIPKPTFKEGKVVNFNYLIPPLSLPVTARRNSHNNHMDHKSPFYKNVLEGYFAYYGYTDEEVKHRYNSRDKLNMFYFKNMEKQVKEIYKNQFDYEEGGNILYAGTPSGASTNLHLLVDFMTELDMPSQWWLGSFYYRRHNSNLLALREKHVAGEDCRILQERPRRTRAKRAKVEKIYEPLLAGFSVKPTLTPVIESQKIRIRLPSKPLEFNEPIITISENNSTPIRVRLAKPDPISIYPEITEPKKFSVQLNITVEDVLPESNWKSILDNVKIYLRHIGINNDITSNYEIRETDNESQGLTSEA